MRDMFKYPILKKDIICRMREVADKDRNGYILQFGQDMHEEDH